MTDVRAQLLEALDKAVDEVPVRVHGVSDWVTYFVDVLLALPGIEIVEVPEGMYVSVRWSREGAIARLNAKEAAEEAEK